MTEIERLQDAKRRALAIADERAKENVQLRAERDALVKALDDLQSAETVYRMTYDLDGYHHQNTLEARGKLRSAGYRARCLLADVSGGKESGNG